MRAKGVAVLAALVLLPVSAAAAEADSEVWEAFLADRAALFDELAPPFVECFQRRDSLIDPLSPIFHGCLDWHSAVHAAYSHLALYRHTAAFTYRDLVEQKVAPHGVSLIPAEHAYQQAKGLPLPLTENPYGFGWFLVLAREHELSTGRDDFREMADYAAGMMTSWFQDRLDDGDARNFVLDTAHANYSWSLLNLDLWAKHTRDAALEQAVRDFAEPLFDPSLDSGCPATRDTAPNIGGFQPACLMRLAAAAHVWGAEVSDWVAERLPADYHVPPVTEPAGCHAGGLNFSRSFALYQLHLVTGETQYRDNYVELIRYHVSRADLYIDPDYLGDPGYLCYSHWVAQFGVRAISLSFEPPPARGYPRPGRTEVVSVASDGALADDHVALPTMSADGRFVAFPSRAENLVPDKTNLCTGFGGGIPCQDIFVHDRHTGVTERVSVASDGTQSNGDASLLSLSADGRFVAFGSSADNLVDGDTNGTADVFVHDRQTGQTERVSVATDGTEGNGHSSNPSISADGRHVAFQSGASNLVPEKTHGIADIFVHDRQTGVTERVSVAGDGTEGDNRSQQPAISADGRHVAFQSYASNLVPDDTNEAADIFVHDRETGVTERVSVAGDGAQGEGDAPPRDAHQPSISGDGRHVAFLSYQSNLVPEDTNDRSDIFVHDRETGTTERVSVASDGAEGNAGSSQAHISGDGRYVAFRSSASNLVDGDTNGWDDIFVHDRETGVTERVSVASDGSPGTRHASTPAVSADGRYIAFRSSADELRGEPAECSSILGPAPCIHVFVRDRGPATGVGALTVSQHDDGDVHVSGWAGFSGQVVASASDPPDDGGPGAEDAGAELTGASLVYRPEQGDVLVRLQLAWLPGERCMTATDDPVVVHFVCERGGGAEGALAPGVAHRRIVYAMGFEIGGAAYEVRARAGSAFAAPAGNPGVVREQVTHSDDPHFALYRCDPDCTEQAPLAGGIGTTGAEVVVAVPLAALGAAEGLALTQIRASTSTEAGVVEPQETLDEVALPDATIPTAQVTLGVAPASTLEGDVVYTTQAELLEGHFSATLDAASLSAGNHVVWARACLGEVCEAHSTSVTVE